MVSRRDKTLGVVLIAMVATALLFSYLLIGSSGDGGFPGGKHVAVIEIEGAIYSPDVAVDELERIIADDRIPVVVLRLNTPGGGVSATQEIYETVLKARDHGIRVVASMGSVAASGGYYIAAACDTIVATPATVTGSIGVIVTYTDLTALMEKIGVGISVRKTGKYKDMGSFSREMTEEEKALIDSLIFDMYDQFVQAVADGRGLDPEYVRTVADGRIFTGRQARGMGFVDELGTYQDAIDIAGEMAGLGEYPPVVYESEESLLDYIIGGISRVAARHAMNGVPSVSYMWTQ